MWKALPFTRRRTTHRPSRSRIFERGSCTNSKANFVQRDLTWRTRASIPATAAKTQSWWVGIRTNGAKIRDRWLGSVSFKANVWDRLESFENGVKDNLKLLGQLWRRNVNSGGREGQEEGKEAAFAPNRRLVTSRFCLIAAWVPMMGPNGSQNRLVLLGGILAGGGV